MLYLHGADMNCCCCCCWTTKRTCLVYVVPLCSMLCLCALRDANATAKREAHSTPPSTICMRILFFGHVPYLLVKRKLDHSNSRAIKDISKSLFNLRSRSIFFFFATLYFALAHCAECTEIVRHAGRRFDASCSARRRVWQSNVPNEIDFCFFSPPFGDP